MRDVHMPIGLDEIIIDGDRRAVNPETVRRLADSIKSIGLKHPITVKRKGEKYSLVAGLHRLEAHKKLKAEYIPACIVTMTKAEARMWEIAENLHRAELSKLERAEQIEEWRELVVQLAPPDQPSERGIRKAAEELGVTREEVRRAETIAHITEDAKEAAVKAGIDDNQSKLLEVAKEPPERQVAKVYELKDRAANVKTWRDEFERIWARGTEDDHAWAREYIDKPVMDRRYK